MTVFDSVNETANKATKTGEDYLKASRDYYQLKIFQQLAIQFSALCKIALVGGLIFLAFIFMATAGAIALGNYLENTALACLIIAGILIIFALLVYWKRKMIDTKVVRKLSLTFFN
ncbi:hypothetical protein [Ascidiimonas sp. W6]|uniref:hypothetical protein n=1 Tax=Ascidiimonas meishanensis TaxID=3128903 RepID=UPI0030EE2840